MNETVQHHGRKRKNLKTAFCGDSVFSKFISIYMPAGNNRYYNNRYYIVVNTKNGAKLAVL
jgi:hypothetical protein